MRLHYQEMLGKGVFVDAEEEEQWAAVGDCTSTKSSENERKAMTCTSL